MPGAMYFLPCFGQRSARDSDGVGPDTFSGSLARHLVDAHCRILGFATEYSTSVRKFTATYVRPIARMQPCTRK
jgi:hypothetical protein